MRWSHGMVPRAVAGRCVAGLGVSSALGRGGWGALRLFRCTVELGTPLEARYAQKWSPERFECMRV